MFSRTPSEKTPRYIPFNRRKIKFFLVPLKILIDKPFFKGKNFFILKFNWFHLKIKLRFYRQQKKEPSKISTTKVLKLNSSLNRQSVKRIQISFVAKSLIGTRGGAFVRLPPYRLDRAQRLLDYRARLSSRGIHASLFICHWWNPIHLQSSCQTIRQQQQNYCYQ